MNCDWSEQVAMLLDGEPATPALTTHLATCTECSDLLDELRADQALLRDALAVPEGVVAEAVLRRIARLRWWFAPPAVAAAALVAAFLLREPAARPVVSQLPAPPAPVSARLDPHPAAPVTTAARAPKPAARPRFRTTSPDKLMADLGVMLQPASTATASADTPVLITAQTADPDVVIVLVPDRKGDE